MTVEPTSIEPANIEPASIEPTNIGALRRWIRGRQNEHRGRGETAYQIYFFLLFAFVVGGMVRKELAAVFWPHAPNASQLAGGALLATGAGALYLALRRLGPLGLSRPAASWLLTAPVSRRRLLLPALRMAVALSAVAGALLGLAVAGHVLPRPVPAAASLIAGAALAGVVVLLLALAAAGLRGAAVWTDRLAGLVLAAGLGGFVVDSAVHAPRATGGWPQSTVLAAVGALAVVVVALLALAVARLGRTSSERILETSKTAGTLWDSLFGVEPSFVADMLERRYWSTRRLRSKRLSPRLPVLVGQDVNQALRRPRRLLWTAALVFAPALFAPKPHWLLALVLLLGGMIAAGAPTANVRTDAANPVLLRLLGLDSREAISQRYWVPGVLATVWYALAFGILQALGDLPAGQWWVLGLALGPVGATAAIRRARSGFVRNDMMAFDTQQGISISPGPFLHLVVGADMLLLALPAFVQIAGWHPLSWLTVFSQAVVGFVGARGYLQASTEIGRVELSRR